MTTNDGRRRRIEARYRALGTREPACTRPGCRETDPFALTGTHPNIVCQEHEAEARGVTAIQLQHPQGQHNGPDKLPTRANDHAVWDSAKRDWPERTLCNPEDSPLLKASASVRSVLDWFRFVIERTLGWVPSLLEWLDDCLSALHGGCWWNAPGFGWEGSTA
jgi:hypothetical protein